jgi:hypothetical protein
MRPVNDGVQDKSGNRFQLTPGASHQLFNNQLMIYVIGKQLKLQALKQ